MDEAGKVKGFLLPIRRITAAALRTEEASAGLSAIVFQNYPTISQDNKTANYEPVPILGRAEPVRIYKNSEARSINLDLQYVALDDVHDWYWVSEQIARIRALVHPYYDRTKQYMRTRFYAPPMVLLNLGSRFVNLPCIVTTVSISSEGEGEEAVLLDKMLPLSYKVTIELETNYAYGAVPGYLNVYKQFSKKGTNSYELGQEAAVEGTDETALPTGVYKDNLTSIAFTTGG